MPDCAPRFKAGQSGECEAETPPGRAGAHPRPTRVRREPSTSGPGSLRGLHLLLGVGFALLTRKTDTGASESQGCAPFPPASPSWVQPWPRVSPNIYHKPRLFRNHQVLCDLSTVFTWTVKGKTKHRLRLFPMVRTTPDRGHGSTASTILNCDVYTQDRLHNLVVTVHRLCSQ